MIEIKRREKGTGVSHLPIIPMLVREAAIITHRIVETGLVLGPDVLFDQELFSEPASQLLSLVERGEIPGIICDNE